MVTPQRASASMASSIPEEPAKVKIANQIVPLERESCSCPESISVPWASVLSPGA
jgi:hypothetical protein